MTDVEVEEYKLTIQDPPSKKINENNQEFTVNINSNSEVENILGEPTSPQISQKESPCKNEHESSPQEGQASIQQMSKRQQKKLKKLKEWEIKKKEKRLKEREKYKKRREELVSKGLPTRVGPSPKELKRNKVDNTKNFLKIAIDLDFDDLMIDRAISKCVKQLLRIYTINRRSESPCKLYFTGIKEQGRIHKVLEKNEGYQNWDVKWHFQPYTEVLEKDKIVYLTSDSDNILNVLDKDAVYIIGGLVDHNHHKGLCYDRAQKLGLKTARLPLNEYVDMKTRAVLSTVHVFEILLHISHGKNWSDAILTTIPARKGAKPKLGENSSTNATSEDD